MKDLVGVGVIIIVVGLICLVSHVYARPTGQQGTFAEIGEFYGRGIK